MLRPLNVCHGQRVAQVQTFSLKMARCHLSAPALFLKTHMTTTIITLSHSPLPTQPPSLQAAQAIGPNPQASPTPRNMLCLATTPTPQCHAILQHLPALTEAPYLGLKFFSLQPHTMFLPQAEWAPPTSPAWEACPLWFLHRIKLVLSFRAEMLWLFRASPAGTHTGNDWIWRLFDSFFTDCPENMQYNAILFAELTLCFIYRHKTTVLITSVLLFHAFTIVFTMFFRKVTESLLLLWRDWHTHITHC